MKKPSVRSGDIVLVPFPFTDLQTNKTRPALIIKSLDRSKDYISLAITSKKKTGQVKIENKDLEKGKLPITSYIQLNKVATLNHALIRMKVATLKKPVFSKVVKEFTAQF